MGSCYNLISEMIRLYRAIKQIKLSLLSAQLSWVVAHIDVYCPFLLAINH